MIDQLPTPNVEDPYAEHLELMRLVLNMNTGAATASVRPVIDGSGATTLEKVTVFGMAIADALRCYAEAVRQQHDLPPAHVIRAVVTTMREELAEPTGGGLSVQVGDELRLPEVADDLSQAQAQSADPRSDDLADRAIRSGQDHDRSGPDQEAEEG